jgi:hypothetical protein
MPLISFWYTIYATNFINNIKVNYTINSAATHGLVAT